MGTEVMRGEGSVGTEVMGGEGSFSTRGVVRPLLGMPIKMIAEAKRKPVRGLQ